ncbi:MlaD family protein [Gordonia malaquae]|uniref:MlaD family protein n=1 Tax=Gordonia malaquae TaxID=410332 RepID=UPI001CBA6227|nr:MlaD family protein [Gordonia malaquae]
MSNATGKFEDNKTVTITTDAIGDGLKGGSEVKYRGLTVGKVSSVSVRDQSTSVKIELTE